MFSLLSVNVVMGDGVYIGGEKQTFEIQSGSKQGSIFNPACISKAAILRRGVLICSKPAGFITHLPWHGLHPDFLSLGKSSLSSLKKKKQNTGDEQRFHIKLKVGSSS